MNVLPAIKTKTWQQIRLISPLDREKALKKAGYNLFKLNTDEVSDIDEVFIDLLTDSGGSAQSIDQRSKAELADNSYGGGASFRRMLRKIKEIFGFPYVLPCHQGRACEHIFNKVMIRLEKDTVVGNIHFDTTRAHIEQAGGMALDFPCPEFFKTNSRFKFKGNVDLEKLKSFLAKNSKKVAYGLITATCNSGGGQPVSLANMMETAFLLQTYGIPLFLDAARYAENTYFIKRYETGKNSTIREMAKQMFNLFDGCLMSAKKDALASMGGFIALRSRELYLAMRPLVTLYEGFVDGYGGISARDMEEVAEGLELFQDEELLADYIENQVGYLGKALDKLGIPLIKPFGGHAIYIDVARFLPNLKSEDLPGQALACAIYLEGGVRTCEIGSVFAGNDANKNSPPRLELLRLAVPRFTYSKCHFDYIADVVARVYAKRDKIQGYTFNHEAPILRHFESTFLPR